MCFSYERLAWNAGGLQLCGLAAGVSGMLDVAEAVAVMRKVNAPLGQK